MTDEVTAGAAEQAQQVEQKPAADVAAAAHTANAQASAAPQAEAAPVTVDEVAAKRYEENLARAKEHGYVEPAEPSLEERVNALVSSVEAAMTHNAPISIEMLAEMKALLGHRG